MKTAVYILLAVAGLGLTWTSLCRIKVMTAETTLKSVRWSIALMAVTGLAVAATGIAVHWFPHWKGIALTALAVAALCVQASSSRLWRHSVPASFTRPGALEQIDSEWLTNINGGKR